MLSIYHICSKMHKNICEIQVVKDLLNLQSFQKHMCRYIDK